MCKTLFHVPPDIFGWPTLGWGVALALWIIVTLLTAVWGSERKRVVASLLATWPLLLVGTLVVVWVLPTIEEYTADGINRGLPVRGYGVAMFLAVAAGVGLAAHRGRQLGLPADVIYGLAIWMFVAGFAGARLFYLVQYRESFRTESWGEFLTSAVNIAQGGLVVYGSLIGGLAAYGLFVWRHRLPVLALGDIVAPSMLLGLAIGRIGCLLNGCCYGGPCEHAWAVRFPSDSPAYMDQLGSGLAQGMHLACNQEGKMVVRYLDPEGPAARAGLRGGEQIVSINAQPLTCDARSQELPSEAQQAMLAPPGSVIQITTARGKTFRWTAGLAPGRSLPIHPAQIYSSLNALVLFCFVLALAPFVQREGVLLAVTLTIYPITRYLLEIVRTDELPLGGWGWTISQTVSLFVLSAAGVLWIIVLRQPRRRRVLRTDALA